MKQADLLIAGGKIVVGQEVLTRDLLVKDGKIWRIIEPQERTEYLVKEQIDAYGKFLLPGVIDTHVHFNDPGFEWREDFLHGTKAAAKGGVTTVLDMPLQNTPALATAQDFENKQRKVMDSAYIDYGFWGALLHGNTDDLLQLQQAGVFAFKSFISPVGDDFDSLSYGEIRQRLLKLKAYDGLSGYHCEDYSIIDCAEKTQLEQVVTRESYLASRPLTAELVAVAAVIALAEETQTRIHIVHVSHPAVAELIKQAKKRGVRVTAETCVHYLIFSNDDLVEQGALYKCAPPLREKKATEQLWNYLLDGTLDLIVSDHSPCRIDEKQETEDEGIFAPWGGISGVQSTLQVMFNEWVIKRGLPLPKLMQLLSTNAAKIFQIDAKGELMEDNDADIVFLDPTAEWEIDAASLAYKNPFSAFENQVGKGLTVKTLVRGQIVYDNQVGFTTSPFGQLLRHAPSA